MATSAKHALLCFLVLLGMIKIISTSRVLKPQELEYQTNVTGKAEHSAKLAFSGGIGIGIGIGEGSGTGNGNGNENDGSVGYGQGSGGGSGHGQVSKTGGAGGIGIGIGIGGGFKWESGGKTGSKNSSKCSECVQGQASSAHCCKHKAVSPPSECFECPNWSSARCCPPEVARQFQHERAMTGQKTAVPLPLQVEDAWAPSN